MGIYERIYLEEYIKKPIHMTFISGELTSIGDSPVDLRMALIFTDLTTDLTTL